jgi:hypothetical protein
MQTTLAVLCDCQQAHGTDPVTQTVLTMLTCPIQLQLTVIGWQPFKGKELTYPFQRMTPEQREAIKGALTAEGMKWSAYEHALVQTRARRVPLRALDVLEALCVTILHSGAYTDRRLRVAVCNILLQRVQANLPVDKATLRALNARLFPAAEST